MQESIITGMLAIGNGESCPYCNTIMTEGIDTFKHLTDNHEKEVVKALFGDLKTDMDNLKQKGKTNVRNNDDN